MPTPIAIPSVPLDAMAAQATSVFTSVWPILAIIGGVVLGAFVFRRVRSMFARRM
jgi:flagellar biogenesis protein FliO